MIPTTIITRDLRCLVVGGLALVTFALFAADNRTRTSFSPFSDGAVRTLHTDSTPCVDPEAKRIAVFEDVGPSMVNVNVFGNAKKPFSLDVIDVPLGTGSGYIWDSHGHIITNHHVVKDATKAQVVILTKASNTNPNDTVKYIREEYEANIVGVDPFKDIAVLKINAPAEHIHPVEKGSSTGLKVGQEAIAIGNPFGLDHTLTAGVISGLDGKMMSQAGRPISHVIQTDAAINPGNSGGALFDSQGKIIGMNTMIYSPSGAFSGIGFTIPVDKVKSIASTLIKHGKVVRPVIGITFLSGQQAMVLGIEHGVLVLDVPEGSNAANAGLRGTVFNGTGGITLGDIIIQCGDDQVDSEVDLFNALEKHKPGNVLKLAVHRWQPQQGKMVEVELETKLQSSDQFGERHY